MTIHREPTREEREQFWATAFDRFTDSILAKIERRPASVEEIRKALGVEPCE